TLLLGQVGDLRVTLAELHSQSPIIGDLSFSPTDQKLIEAFREKFDAIRATVGEYRALLEEHEHAEFRIGDASREWQKLQEIEQCLATIEMLTTDPKPEEGASTGEHEPSAEIPLDQFDAFADATSNPEKVPAPIDVA